MSKYICPQPLSCNMPGRMVRSFSVSVYKARTSDAMDIWRRCKIFDKGYTQCVISLEMPDEPKKYQQETFFPHFGLTFNSLLYLCDAVATQSVCGDIHLECIFQNGLVLL
ncbi:MAG: hypothetical protein NC206_07610 [Bacteroides sp.]|nr:hypothetical protein [Roseburia sp.]MCM1346937.1 hypothetical protein [Bacteroides sp.]MCM1421518.1 hypothetical protein [Bacteroides sp.]